MRAVVVSAALLASTVAQAEYYSGNKLHTLCGLNEIGASELSIGYVVGVADAVITLENLGMTTRVKMFCIPEAVSQSQTRDVVCQYLSKNPHSRHYSAPSLAALALAQAWPCPKP